MKSKPMKMVLPLCLSLLSLQAALAGPLQRRQVAADAVWLVHADFERVRQTPLGQYFLGELEKPQAGVAFAALRVLIDFDARKKLSSATLYSHGATPEDAVLLLQGDFEIERLVNMAQAGQEYHSNKHRGCMVHNWIDFTNPVRGGSPARNYGATHTNGTIVLGQRFGRVTEALDVLDGLQGSLEKTNAFPQAGAASGPTILVAVTRLGDFSQLAPQAAMLKTLKTLNFSATERENQLALELSVEAENEEAAKGLLTINRGLLALAAMQAGQSPWAKMLQSISTSQTNATVAASFQTPAADLLQAIRDTNSAGPRPR